ncbi:MAG: hypothetical protein KDC44_21915 [Phaeodactylibacter sp.]|nr:hypothetical protein [Phaeodactylibacter sp.]
MHELRTLIMQDLSEGLNALKNFLTDIQTHELILDLQGELSILEAQVRSQLISDQFYGYQKEYLRFSTLQLLTEFESRMLRNHTPHPRQLELEIEIVEMYEQMAQLAWDQAPDSALQPLEKTQKRLLLIYEGVLASNQ